MSHILSVKYQEPVRSSFSGKTGSFVSLSFEEPAVCSFSVQFKTSILPDSVIRVRNNPPAPKLFPSRSVSHVGRFIPSLEKSLGVR